MDGQRRTFTRVISTYVEMILAPIKYAIAKISDLHVCGDDPLLTKKQIEVLQ